VLLGRRHRPSQDGAERREPHEDQREPHDFEGREGDAACDEDDDRGDQQCGDGRRCQPEPPDGPRTRQHQDENAQERQHHPGCRALVDGRVDVQRHEADDRKVTAERGDERHEQPRGVPTGVDDGVEPGADVGEGASYAGGEEDERRPCRQGAEIEDSPREVAVGAQLAEMEVPPVAVARRGRGEGGREHEQSDGGHHQVMRFRATQCLARSGSPERRELESRSRSDRRRHWPPNVSGAPLTAVTGGMA